ncbi:MAG: hypothetical protein OQK73_05955 [Gammaproteobacteria bacterium]|nr:hypothetical protein [Gammaproteobacteria bacterium]
MMTEEKRKGETPIPDHVKDYLNEAQLGELHKIEGFGWELKFIRRPLFLEKVAVVINPEGNSIGILEEDGRLNLEPNIDLRDE